MAAGGSDQWLLSRSLFLCSKIRLLKVLKETRSRFNLLFIYWCTDGAERRTNEDRGGSSVLKMKFWVNVPKINVLHKSKTAVVHVRIKCDII